MIKVSATKLRNNLFKYLDKVAKGEAIVIQRNNQEIARLFPVAPSDWRERMSTRPKLLVAPDEVIKPLEGLWEDYV